MHIVLYEPEIPQNTGNIARTCAAAGATLHLVRPFSFELSDRYLKRAGLDYFNMVRIVVHDDFEACRDDCPGLPMFFFTTKGARPYTSFVYSADAMLVFGKETRGLPEALLRKHPDRCARIPMLSGARSLNLSNSVAVALYEALRQNDFAGLQDTSGLSGRDEAASRWADYL
ncbi:MAG: tRNA (cytidine(34)-2'-O)-methyltransferase [Clostridia bacterium]|nr:tRNA (cytidine(34)-2'-O)-methyltransferase [Clostridia bacterium]